MKAGDDGSAVQSGAACRAQTPGGAMAPPFTSGSALRLALRGWMWALAGCAAVILFIYLTSLRPEKGPFWNLLILHRLTGSSLTILFPAIMMQYCSGREDRISEPAKLLAVVSSCAAVLLLLWLGWNRNMAWTGLQCCFLTLPMLAFTLYRSHTCLTPGSCKRDYYKDRAALSLDSSTLEPALVYAVLLLTGIACFYAGCYLAFNSFDPRYAPDAYFRITSQGFMLVYLFSLDYGQMLRRSFPNDSIFKHLLLFSPLTTAMAILAVEFQPFPIEDSTPWITLAIVNAVFVILHFLVPPNQFGNASARTEQAGKAPTP